jgi:hypothetical protein
VSDKTPDSQFGFDRLSLRAVLVREGEDTEAALAAAGIHEPVSVPVTFGPNSDGSGLVPDLTAILEQEDTGQDTGDTDAERGDAAQSNPGRLGAAAGGGLLRSAGPLAPIANRRG